MHLTRREDIAAKLIVSSITKTGRQIDTLQLRYPRPIHSEFMTHRAFSRNASSSRAIPTASLLIRDSEMFVPNFRLNKPGMQPGDYLSPGDQILAEEIWRDMARACIEGCQKLSSKTGLNVHKQHANRPLEWFGYIDVVVTATDWKNFYFLRDHEMAQEEIHLLADVMIRAKDQFEPTLLRDGDWHLPYITDKDREEARANYSRYLPLLKDTFAVTEDLETEISSPDAILLAVSAARCCRVSYSKHDGSPSTFEEDIERFGKLMPPNGPIHASPMEHQATPLAHFAPSRQGNFRDFAQFRQFIVNHAVW